MVALSVLLEHVTGVPHSYDGPFRVCADPGGEPYIAQWDEEVLGAQPTEEQMTAAELALEIDAACARLNARRDAIQYGVYTDSHGHGYDVDAKSREKMTGLEAKIANGLVLPPGFSWTGADNEERVIDNAGFMALTTEILYWTQAVHGAAVATKKAVRPALTIEAALAAEAAVLWP